MAAARRGHPLARCAVCAQAVQVLSGRLGLGLDARYYDGEQTAHWTATSTDARLPRLTVWSISPSSGDHSVGSLATLFYRQNEWCAVAAAVGHAR